MPEPPAHFDRLQRASLGAGDLPALTATLRAEGRTVLALEDERRNDARGDVTRIDLPAPFAHHTVLLLGDPEQPVDPIRPAFVAATDTLLLARGNGRVTVVDATTMTATGEHGFGLWFDDFEPIEDGVLAVGSNSVGRYDLRCRLLWQTEVEQVLGASVDRAGHVHVAHEGSVAEHLFTTLDPRTGAILSQE